MLRSIVRLFLRIKSVILRENVTTQTYLFFKVPNAAQVLRLKEEQIKSNSNRLCEVLEEYNRVVECIPEVILPLMKPFTDRVDETIKPGLAMLNWTSLNIPECK